MGDGELRILPPSSRFLHSDGPFGLHAGGELSGCSIGRMSTGTERRRLRVWLAHQCGNRGNCKDGKRDRIGGENMSAQELLVILLVGLIAGWLAVTIMRGTGYGLVADIAIGIV